MRIKLAAFVISGFVTGVVGGLWFYFIGQALPETVFDPLFDLTVALMAFLGGFGTLAGPVLGALILEPLQQHLTLQFTNGYLSEILLGALFLLVILFLPRGLHPQRAGLADRRAGLAGAAAAAARPGAGRGGQADGPRRQEGRQVTALLRAEGVSKAFGGVQALSDCTVEVERAASPGLIGPNGSGKTTLFNVITGYERADPGQVYSATPTSPTRRRDRVFALRHRPHLPADPGLPAADRDGEHARRGRQHAAVRRPRRSRNGWPGRRPADRRRAMELLEFTGIARHAGALAGTLSYGQRKLLELAYVLIADPEIMLLDEPAGGINPTLIDAHRRADPRAEPAGQRRS